MGRQCKKDIEITLDDGTFIEAVVTVKESDSEENKNVDTGYAEIGSWTAEHDGDLDEDQQAEFNEKVEDVIHDEEWDFDNAPEVDDENEDEED